MRLHLSHVMSARLCIARAGDDRNAAPDLLLASVKEKNDLCVKRASPKCKSPEWSLLATIQAFGRQLAMTLRRCIAVRDKSKQLRSLVEGYHLDTQRGLRLEVEDFGRPERTPKIDDVRSRWQDPGTERGSAVDTDLA